ncbi:MAG: histidine kinase [Planctomycetes bacterium]|nr:histidine kinase [Planctomycetota bacterium]
MILESAGILPAIGGNSFRDAFGFLLVLGYHGTVMTYWTVLGIQAALRYYRRYQEREKEALQLELQSSELKTQLVRAQLSALKVQLQPHFLFNTLNAIMVLVRQQKGHEAEEMIGRFSDLLRCVLEDVDAQEVPLRRELEYLKLYLSIEEVRFQDRLRVEMDVSPDVLDAAVPHMVLQPIVENAIRHGIGRSSTAGRIRVVARRVKQALEVVVEDDGPGLAPGAAESRAGIGLKNTKARLLQLYGDAATLTLQNGERGGAVARIVLPYRIAPEPSKVMEVHATQCADRR